MTALAANMEWLFTEAGARPSDRIRAAAAHGFESMEIWGWREKEIGAIEAALADTGVTLLSLVVDPQLQITDRATHERYLQGVRDWLNGSARRTLSSSPATNSRVCRGRNSTPRLSRFSRRPRASLRAAR